MWISGISTWGSTRRSTTPAIFDVSAAAIAARLRNDARSCPNSFTATCARIPDMMWSRRCEIGCPTMTATPAMCARRSRTSAITASRSRPPVLRLTSISEELTPSACSSSSARPVRRDVCATSGISRSIRSAIFPSRLDSVSVVPGSESRLTVRVPSANGGRNSPPIWVNAPIDTATPSAVPPRTTHGRRNANRTSTASPRLSHRNTNGSRVRSTLRPRDRTKDAMTGVTVSATTSDTNRVVR